MTWSELGRTMFLPAGEWWEGDNKESLLLNEIIIEKDKVESWNSNNKIGTLQKMLGIHPMLLFWDKIQSNEIAWEKYYDCWFEKWTSI